MFFHNHRNRLFSLSHNHTDSVIESDGLVEVTRGEPCLHCGKPDWCYRLGELTACKRDAQPATGWTKTSEADAQGTYYYAPVQTKAIRPKSKKEYFYKDRSGRNLVRVTRIDDGAGNKKFYQARWENSGWVNGLTDGVKPRIPIYRYAEVKQAIAQGKIVFFLEGEEIVDQLWNLGLPATTSIAGCGNYRSYGSYIADLEGADLVLCPDRDRGGVKYMKEVAKDFPSAKWLFAPPSEFFWQHLPESAGVDIGDWITQGATVEDILSKIQSSPTVTGDSDNSGDSCNSLQINISATVTTVTKILRSGLSDYEERQNLENVLEQSGLKDKPFWQLVSSLKCQLDEIQPEDELRLNNLIDWHDAQLDFNKALPSIASDLLHDANVLNVDPIVIWQPLLAAALSLAGKRVKLDVESHTVPAIVWTLTVLESGGGKTRADKLVLTPLKQLQIKARRQFEKDQETYQNWDGSGQKPDKPRERKYLFEVATIQAVIKRLGEQGENGTLWARDELAGLLKSFGQFSKSGENEGLECLLKTWDGDPVQVDRVNQADSFATDETALSVTGGIQPGIYRKTFKDPSDSQGQLARFLIANPKPKKPKRFKGYCKLADKLPDLYDWLANCQIGTIKLSKSADRFYDKLYEEIGEQAWETSQPAIRAWMLKLPTHLLRIALGLHLIECYHDRNRNYWELQKDTLQKAVLFAQYYRSAFHVTHETTADSDDISSILLKIYDASITKYPEGISTRDAYRTIKAIQYRAKDAGRDIGAYTAELFAMLEQRGKGQVIKSGRQIKFVASLSPAKKVEPIEETEPNINDTGDSLTQAETQSEQATQVSPENECHPVTVAVTLDSSPDETPSPTSVATSPDTSELAEGQWVTIHNPNSPHHEKLAYITRIHKSCGKVWVTAKVDETKSTIDLPWGESVNVFRPMRS